MILLESTACQVGNVKIFQDHRSNTQFYFLPTQVSISTNPERIPVFSFLRYQIVDQTIAYLNFDAQLEVQQDDLARATDLIIEKEKQAKLTPVQLSAGCIQLIILEAQKNAFDSWTVGEVQAPLLLQHKAAFSAQLSGFDAVRAWQAFQTESTFLGLVARLEYEGIRPALKVKIQANWKQIRHYLSSINKQNNVWTGREIREEIKSMLHTQVILLSSEAIVTNAVLDAIVNHIMDVFKCRLFEGPAVVLSDIREVLPQDDWLFRLKYTKDEENEEFILNLNRQVGGQGTLHLVSDLREFRRKYGKDERFFKEGNTS